MKVLGCLLRVIHNTRPITINEEHTTTTELVFFSNLKFMKLTALYTLKKCLFVPTLILGIFTLFTTDSYSQIIPEVGEIQCFLAGEGGIFTDNGGPGGDDAVDGAPGNYANCDCVTTTTICSADGSDLTITMSAFTVFATFDWLVILDGDNQLDEVYPFSIIDNPSFVDLQLFNNADGVGDGGSENYGPGAEEGIENFVDMPNTVFTSTNPNGCITFVFRASGVVDDSGWESIISTSSAVGHPGDNIACDSNVDCFPPGNVMITDLQPFSAEVSWDAVDGASNYTIEYGLAGFQFGTGTTFDISTTSINLSGLEENTEYEYYLVADCGADGLSNVVGPFFFETPYLNPPSTCIFTLNLFDSFGDGWNGSVLDITINNETTSYTLDNVNDDGNAATFEVEVFDGEPIILNYTAGAFQNEVTYEFLDPDGLVLFNDGPFPATGEVFNAIGICPVCPAPAPSSVNILNITDTTANVLWNAVTVANSYILEYGPSGFPQGVGLMLSTVNNVEKLEGLNPCVDYDVYLTAVCGVDSSSTTIGPFSFTTIYTPGDPGDTCTYSLELFDSFGDGWNGSFLTVDHNGTMTDYTIPTGTEAFYDVTLISNVPATFNYTQGGFANEITYNIIDPDGNLIFSDGPFPATGDVLTIIACPTCPGPLDANIDDVNADNATISWTPSTDDPPGDYVIEWGPFGFTLGTANADTISTSNTSYTFSNLEENTYYDVYIYLDCFTERSKPIGPFSFNTIWLNDIGVVGINAPDPDAQCDLGSAETVTISIQNFGQLPQTLFPFQYSVNGVPAGIPFPTDGFFTGVIGNDSTQIIQFETTFDFSVPGIYVIEAWTELDVDSDFANDTFQIEIITALPKPLAEDFEGGAFPAGWTSDEFNPYYFALAHNNPTALIADNIFAGDPLFTVTTHRVGPILPGDSLTFDYRYVDWFAGTNATTLGPNDSLCVQISTDCEETFETIFVIDSSNHVTSLDLATIVIDLTPYEGAGMSIRFVGKWGQGDYWLDLDNINIPGCPATLGLLADVVHAIEGEEDGSIALDINFGAEPYDILWDTGDTTNVVEDLPSGTYTVVVTDNNGCMDEQSFVVGSLVGTEDLVVIENISVSPNPTTDIAFLDIELSNAADLTVQLFSMNGQMLFEAHEEHVQTSTHELDLSAYPNGMYLVRVLTDNNRAHFEKIILAK